MYVVPKVCNILSLLTRVCVNVCTNADNYNNICYFVVLIEHLRLTCPFINCMVIQTYTYISHLRVQLSLMSWS